MSMNALTPPPLGFRGSALRWLATFAAAALLATLIVAPVQAQQTGTINAVGQGLNFNTTATINSNREWEVSYTADLSTSISTAKMNCNAQKKIYPSIDCTIESPYIMRYGVLDRSTCFALSTSDSGVPRYSQAVIQGINGIIPLTSWQQTLRAKPDTSYCIAVYVANSVSWYHKAPLAAGSFITPSDPNPPAPTAWTPAPQSLGCGAETTLALVRQCFQCKYGSGGSWSMSANTCSG